MQKNNEEFTVTDSDTGETYSPSEFHKIPRVLSKGAFTPLPEGPKNWSVSEFFTAEIKGEKEFNQMVKSKSSEYLRMVGLFPSPTTVAAASRTATPANVKNDSFIIKK